MENFTDQMVENIVEAATSSALVVKELKKIVGSSSLDEDDLHTIVDSYRFGSYKNKSDMMVVKMMTEDFPIGTNVAKKIVELIKNYY